jgi:glutaredoxin
MKTKTRTAPHTSFGPNGSCPDCEPDKEAMDQSTLTDAECDFIIQRLLWKLRDTTEPIAFFREMKRGVVFEVAEGDRGKVRELVRLFARADTDTAQ